MNKFTLFIVSGKIYRVGRLLSTRNAHPLINAGVCSNFYLLYSWHVRKKFSQKKSYFSYSNTPTKTNLTLISKLVSKSYMKYQKVLIFVIGISEK
jgi:hypothetical protein